jgi:CubicO group peptidase (beta-lactamase class C family)
MKYSGGGSTILQLALMDVYREPFHDIVRRVVLNPIGMSDTNFSLPLTPEDDGRAARGHNQDGEAMAAKYLLHPELYAAGMWSTASDLAKFAVDVQKAVAGFGGSVLTPSQAREMLSPVGIGDYAIGFSIRRDGNGWYFAHSGSNQGFAAYLIAHKVRGYGVVALTNGLYGMRFINELIRRVSKIYEWDSITQPLYP